MSSHRLKQPSRSARMSEGFASTSSTTQIAPAAPPQLHRQLHQSWMGAVKDRVVADEADLDIQELKTQLHRLEMENQRLRLDLQKRPTQREHSDLREEIEKLEMLFAQGSQENEKLMMRMKEKDDREKELDRALSKMLGVDWPIQLGVAQPSSVAPFVDFESTPLPAQRSFRTLGHSGAHGLHRSMSIDSPSTPTAQICSRSREIGEVSAARSSTHDVKAQGDDLMLEANSRQSRSIETTGLSAMETQQLLRLLLHGTESSGPPNCASAQERQLVKLFMERVQECQAQLTEQERRGSAREQRIRALMEEAMSHRA